MQAIGVPCPSVLRSGAVSASLVSSLSPCPGALAVVARLGPTPLPSLPRPTTLQGHPGDPPHRTLLVMAGEGWSPTSRLTAVTSACAGQPDTPPTPPPTQDPRESRRPGTGPHHHPPQRRPQRGPSLDPAATRMPTRLPSTPRHPTTPHGHHHPHRELRPRTPANTLRSGGKRPPTPPPPTQPLSPQRSAVRSILTRTTHLHP